MIFSVYGYGSNFLIHYWCCHFLSGLQVKQTSPAFLSRRVLALKLVHSFCLAVSQPAGTMAAMMARFPGVIRSERLLQWDRRTKINNNIIVHWRTTAISALPAVSGRLNEVIHWHMNAGQCSLLLVCVRTYAHQLRFIIQQRVELGKLHVFSSIEFVSGIRILHATRPNSRRLRKKEMRSGISNGVIRNHG